MTAVTSNFLCPKSSSSLTPCTLLKYFFAVLSVITIASGRWAPVRLACDSEGRWVNPVDELPYSVNPKLVEVKFAVPLDDDGEFILCGTMDAIAQHRELLTRSPIDHKTTGNVTQDWVRGYQNDSQMSGYIYALRYMTGEEVNSAFINVIEIRKLPGSERKCKTHAVPYSECAPAHLKYMQFITDRTPRQLEAWRQTAIKLARQFRDDLERYGTFQTIEGADTRGMFTGSCTYCELADWCMSGRLEKRAKTMLVYEPWIDPHKGFAPKEGGID